MNPAMILTGSRLVTGPLFAYFFLNALQSDVPQFGWLAAAFVTVLILELSDAFDGMVARARKEVTSLGKIFDPVCDAISRQTIFLSFLLVGLIPMWMFLIFLYRDSLVYLLRIMVAKDGTVMAASKAGKFKAITQAAATFIILLFVFLDFRGVQAPLGEGALFTDYALWVMLVPSFFALQSGFEYFKNNWSVIVKMAQPDKS